MFKNLMFIIPLSFVLISNVSAHNDDSSLVARGGAGGAGGGRAGGFEGGHMDAGRGDLNRNNLDHSNWNRGAYDGYGEGVYNTGGYNNGVYYNGGYGTGLMQDPVLTPNDDMDSLYLQNQKNMEKTGQ
jgi:hypothetical protein